MLVSNWMVPRNMGIKDHASTLQMEYATKEASSNTEELLFSPLVDRQKGSDMTQVNSVFDQRLCMKSGLDFMNQGRPH